MQRRANQQNLMKPLFLAMGVLIVALIVVLIIIVTGKGTPEQQTIQAVESGKFVQGVKVAGVDVSGLTYDEAAEIDQIKEKAQDAEKNFTYKFTASGKEFTYGASDLGIKADVDKTLTDAMKWGNVGDADTKDKQMTEASASGKNFDIEFSADADALKSFLKQHKPDYDVLPKDATVKYDATANPPFKFVSEENGADVDVVKLAGMIADNINKGDYSEVEAPVLVTTPSLDLKTLQANFSTTPIAEPGTSSFAKGKLDAPDRVNNIKIMGNFVNGTVIEPGDTWSLNDTAGPRDASTAKTVGWTMAPGLQDGTTTDQYGGGVCQISSTTYNAAINAGLTIVERHPHSWPSEYIPKGMDATVTTGYKDLKIANPSPLYPVLITCAVDTTAKNVTVNVYGPPMQYTIKFTVQQTADKSPGAPIYHYNETAAPDGTQIAPNTSYQYIQSKDYLEFKVTEHFYDKNGNEIGHGTPFGVTIYQAYPAEYYCNYPKSGPTGTPAPTASP